MPDLATVQAYGAEMDFLEKKCYIAISFIQGLQVGRQPCISFALEVLTIVYILAYFVYTALLK